MKVIDKGSVQDLGGKAYHLTKMTEAGLPVPSFKILSFSFWEQLSFPKTNDMAQLSQVMQEQLKACFEQKNWDLLDTFAKDKCYSVRSSATVEDGRQHSFAGQFETRLDVRQQDLKEAVKACLLSLYDLSVLHYFEQQQIDLTQARMLVIVQDMVPSQLSGIYFTANPKGIISEHLLVFGEGRGDGIVEDKVPTTTITYLPSEDRMEREAGSRGPEVDRATVLDLYNLAQKAIGAVGPYLDMEFALVNQTIYLLQVRPITTLPQGPLIILDNSNIVESYPGLNSPLTISFVKEAYRSIFTSLAKRLVGKDKQLLASFEPIFQDMVAPMNSRLYYQLQNWYQLLHLLPFSKRLIPIWQEMLGIQDLEIPVSAPKVSWLSHMKISWRIVVAFWQSPKAMAELNKEFQAIEVFFEEHYHSTASLADLKRLYQTLHEAILTNWDLTLINDLYAFVYLGLLKKRLAKEELQAEIAGIEAIESMKPALALSDLQQALRQRADWQEELGQLMTLTAKDLEERLQAPQTDLQNKIAAFINCYGDRAPEELKLETQTFRSHPHSFLLLLQQKQPTISPLKPETGRQKPLSFVERFLKKRAFLGIAHRESSRLNRTRIYGMVRTIVRTAGQRLVESKRLDNVEDVFFLPMEVIFQDKEQTDLRPLIEAARYKEQQDYQLTLPRRLLFLGQIREKYPSQQMADRQKTTSHSLQGIGCSKGEVEGQVLLVDDIKNLEDVSGKILVTKMTDPGWVYALMQAKGVIAEQGSLLSHTAIISRELGIPAVVNVPHVTSDLQNGEVIWMNGDSGQIIRKEKAHD